MRPDLRPPGSAHVASHPIPGMGILGSTIRPPQWRAVSRSVTVRSKYVGFMMAEGLSAQDVLLISADADCGAPQLRHISLFRCVAPGPEMPEIRNGLGTFSRAPRRICPLAPRPAVDRACGSIIRTARRPTGGFGLAQRADGRGSSSAGSTLTHVTEPSPVTAWARTTISSNHSAGSANGSPPPSISERAIARAPRSRTHRRLLAAIRATGDRRLTTLSGFFYRPGLAPRAASAASRSTPEDSATSRRPSEAREVARCTGRFPQLVDSRSGVIFETFVTISFRNPTRRPSRAITPSPFPPTFVGVRHALVLPPSPSRAKRRTARETHNRLSPVPRPLFWYTFYT